MAATLSPDLLNEPLSPPPPGVTPDFVHPESEASEIYIAAGICIPLILIFTAMRFYAKLKIMKGALWNDCRWPNPIDMPLY